MFTVMNDGSVFSNHDTREQAETEIAKARKETLEEAARLIEKASDS